MTGLIISVSGLRGTIGDQLTPAVTMQYVAAMASQISQNSEGKNLGKARRKIVIGRDGRESGEMLARAAASTLQAHGFDVLDLGVAATPTVGVYVRHAGAVAGLQISASHNPREYNGIKLFGSDGRVLSKAKGELILQAYQSQQAAWVRVSELGQYEAIATAYEPHAKLVLQTIDVDSIKQRGFKVLLDCNRGAGGTFGKFLLESLGCEVKILGSEPDGQFEHPPEPLAENLTSVCKQVAEGSYDVAFCQDPDADRLAVIDEHGSFIGEELTLALCLMQVFEKEHGLIVTNCASSSISRWLAEQNQSSLEQSAVGEANVADLMIKRNATFGGEGNGGPIDPKVGYVRDSFVGMARILALLTSRKQPLSEIVGGLPPLSMHKGKIDLSTERLPEFFEALKTAWPDADAFMPDGLKLQWADRWLLVRGSNTEPIVRLIAEASSSDKAKELCDQAAEIAAKL